MKKEFLEGLGLDADTISKIQTEYGKLVTGIKTDNENLKIENANLKGDIAVKDGVINTQNNKITELEKIDIDGIKSAEYERGKQEAAKEVTKLKLDTALEGALTKAGARNTKALRGLLDMDKIKFENDTLTGLDEQIEDIKKENDYLFESSQTKPKFSQSTPGAPAGVSKEDFSKMSYNERLKLYNDNPEMYKELSKQE